METKTEVEKLSLKSLDAKFTLLSEQISTLTDIVHSLVKKPEAPKVEPEVAPQVSMAGGFPIPVEYREIVDNNLNKKFGIDINYLSDTASFEFSVLVPKEYSNASPTHWETYHQDRRSRVIQNAYGANGVRDWVMLVYENFGPETKSRITFDRSQP